MTKGDLLYWAQSQPDWGVQSSLEPVSSSCGGFVMLGGGAWRGHSPDLPGIAGAGEHICRTCEMGWGSWLVLGIHHVDGIAVLSSKH